MTATPEPDFQALRARQLELVVRGDRNAALLEAGRALETGLSLADFVFEVLAPVQSQIGLLWQDGRITTEQEHIATNIAEILLTLAASRHTPANTGANLVLCLADRDHHNLPARMIAELLRLDGHRVTFLGAPRPGPSLTTMLEKLRPDAVVLSCSLAMNLPGLRALADTAHESGIAVLGGGRGFAGEPARARRLGLDAHAAQLDEVEDALARMSGMAPAPAPAPSDRAQQHDELAAARGPLVEELMERIRWRADPLLPRPLRDPRILRDYTTNLMRFLEAAVLCDDRILTDYTAWLGARFATLRASPALLPTILDITHERLALDTPIAARTVARTRG